MVYIDGSNFYFSIKNTFQSKVDIGNFCKKLIGNRDDLVQINYYIAPVDQIQNPEMYAKQQSFFDKLREVNNLKIIFGRLERRKKDGEYYFVEKATDVNLALDIVLDAQSNKYDEAFLISNDGDFSGAVKAAIERFSKNINYVAIGTNKTISYHLKKVSSKTLKINNKFIQDLILV
ncbi:NYN domain-containing protein [archaeon]|nr:NYN domain-containing protein [archaeon]MBT4373348.1 NYN domain-containing protein [archaeon]MBT4531796.1 NYN domain-containing protein [archaeon]MBT7001463.1 NYN domain-containing protein [archaeon]MBT7282645.1 NYN domain-containing protein [archaeon]